MNNQERNEKLKNAYINRVKIHLTHRAWKLLCKGKKAYTVERGVGYEIRVNSTPELFDAKGNPVSKSELKRIARSLK